AAAPIAGSSVSTPASGAPTATPARAAAAEAPRRARSRTRGGVLADRAARLPLVGGARAELLSGVDEVVAELLRGLGRGDAERVLEQRSPADRHEEVHRQQDGEADRP